jgi:hypothetical protein
VLLVVSLAGLKMCSEDGRVCYHGDWVGFNTHPPTKHCPLPPTG